MTKTWQQLELAIRSIASAKFGAPSKSETVGGVKCDCVIRPAADRAYFVEITKEKTLSKLRTDLAKFELIRNECFRQNIYGTFYFVTEGTPPPAIINAGRDANVNVVSASDFINICTSRNSYINLRGKGKFGSAIDLYTGQPDPNNYVTVSYHTEDGSQYNASEIAEQMLQGKSFVLVGAYGTGKSRLIKEAFDLISNSPDSAAVLPIAVNLRENWGLKRAEEIVQRHLVDLGLQSSSDDVMRVAFTNQSIFLIDGFDEISAQSWSDDPSKLANTRALSLVGVKDLIGKARGGVLVTGRDHYFNDDLEMINCLGIGPKSPTILRCNEELDESNFRNLCGWTTKAILPSWLPKKPLIATIIRDLGKAGEAMLSTGEGQADFWDVLIDTFCEREAKIHPILDSNVIRDLYTRIGRIARCAPTPLGPLPIKSINSAFEETTGKTASDESAIILQRLPGLGRHPSSASDRQFADSYILDGLKAEDVLNIFNASGGKELDETWKHPIENFGAFYLATKIEASSSIKAASSFASRHISRANKVLISDIISAIMTSGYPVEMGGLRLQGGSFYTVNFAESNLSDITFYSCHFESIDLSEATPNKVTIRDSTIQYLAGSSDEAGLPAWVDSCLVDGYQKVDTLAAIKKADLGVAQTFLLSSLRKLFLQPGAGRRESSMYKGYADSKTKWICEKVIDILVKEKICSRHRGTTETLFLPDRSLTDRAKRILSEMTRSTDTLWLQVDRLNSKA